MAFGSGSGSGRQRLSDISRLSAVARGKLPQQADPLEEDSDVDVEADGDDAAAPVTVKKSKFFSAKGTTGGRSTRARSDQPRRPVARVDSLEDDLPTVDQIFGRFRPSSPVELEDAFPLEFKQLTPPSDKSSPSATSPVSVSPCAPATPQAEPVEDPSEFFSSPQSTRVRRARESSMDGYISSSPPRRGETPRKMAVRSREDSLAAVEEAEMEVDSDVVAAGVDLTDLCTKERPVEPVAAQSESMSEFSDVGGSEDALDGDGSTEDKHAVIAKGWRERFSMKKAPSPFSKSSPLLSRTSLPTPTRPLGSQLPIIRTSTSARSLSTPTFLGSRATNIPPSSVASQNTTPLPGGSDVFGRTPSAKPEAPRSLPPRFVFAPVARGKENASVAPETPTAAVAAAAPKRKRAEAIIDLDADDDEGEVLVLGSSQKKRATPPSSQSQSSSQERRAPGQEGGEGVQMSPTRTNSIRKRLDVFRFRPKMC